MQREWEENEHTMVGRCDFPPMLDCPRLGDLGVTSHVLPRSIPEPRSTLNQRRRFAPKPASQGLSRAHALRMDSAASHEDMLKRSAQRSGFYTLRDGRSNEECGTVVINDPRSTFFIA
ncbi:hypothetical protein MRX96_006529 [Rhipicephalus microplus]